MFSVVQTNFNGIDGIEYREQKRPQITDNGVIVKMKVLPVLPSDFKKETSPNATSDKSTALPRIIGMGGVGQVVEVGKKRDQNLLNKRVLVMTPTGAYSHYVLSEKPDLLFLLPATVDDQSAAALFAGPGIALTLKREIDQSETKNIIITGANSVVGLYLLQMLDNKQKNIWPLVTPASKQYFQKQLPNIRAYTIEELPKIEADGLIIDIAGSQLLSEAISKHLKSAEIISISLTGCDKTTDFKFIHENFDPNNYRHFIAQLENGQLRVPIDRVLSVKKTKEAQHYVKESHSRGRVLVSFEE